MQAQNLCRWPSNCAIKQNKSLEVWTKKKKFKRIWILPYVAQLFVDDWWTTIYSQDVHESCHCWQAAVSLKFAQEYVNCQKEKCSNILFTNESKIIVFGGTGPRHVRCPPITEYKAQYTQKIVKHGGAKLMIWESFSYNGVGQIYRIRGDIMDRYAYVSILYMQNGIWL